jgi:hypothetical protein
MKMGPLPRGFSQARNSLYFVAIVFSNGHKKT